MPKYQVTMPIAGSVSLEVEAENPKAAIEAFWDHPNIPHEPDEWDFVEHVCEGNVCYAMQMNVDVQLLS